MKENSLFKDSANLQNISAELPFQVLMGNFTPTSSGSEVHSCSTFLGTLGIIFLDLCQFDGSEIGQCFHFNFIASKMEHFLIYFLANLFSFSEFTWLLILLTLLDYFVLLSFRVPCMYVLCCFLLSDVCY